MSRDTKKKGIHCKPRIIYGLHSVQEHLRTVPHKVAGLYLLASLQGSAIDRLAREQAIAVRYESRKVLDLCTQGGGHQGVVARLRPFSFIPLREVLTRGADFLLVLDGILDPRNLGALLRTAEAVGVGGVILPERRSAPLSPVVEKAAAGATAYVPLCRVENLARALDSIREAGYWLIGLASDARQTLYELRPSLKIAFLLGGEEKGLRYLTRQKCDSLVAIPMQGKIQSLNVSVAGAVALYELLRRKKYEGKTVDLH